MQSDISSLIGVAGAIWEPIRSSAFFGALTVFLGAYALVVLIDVVLLLFLRDISSDLKKTLYGGKRPMISSSKLMRRWEAVMARLSSGNPSQYKVAVLEADAIAEEMLGGIGYDGANMKERLDAVQPGQIVALEGLRTGHDIRNRIIRDPSFAISREETASILNGYKGFFDELELF